MTRGKHGSAAQAKADDRAVLQIRALETELAAEREAHRLTRVELQAAKDRNSSASMAAKREAVAVATANLQADLDAANEEIAERKLWLKVIGGSHERLSSHYKRTLMGSGMTGTEAHEQMLRFVRYIPRGDRIIDLGPNPVATFDSEELRLFGGRTTIELTDDEKARLLEFQRAKGYRHQEDLM